MLQIWTLFSYQRQNYLKKSVCVCVCSALNSSDIKILGVDLLPGYYDPFSGRTLTKGEVGCFLSHYYIWKEVRGHTLSHICQIPFLKLKLKYFNLYFIVYYIRRKHNCIYSPCKSPFYNIMIQSCENKSITSLSSKRFYINFSSFYVTFSSNNLK